MISRSFLICVALITANYLQAQEESPPGVAPVSGSSPTASPVSTTPSLSSAATPSPSETALPQLTDMLFKNLKARAIGPAVMGGRVSDIAIDSRNPFIFYVGLGHGGVFKTNDNGVTFDPIFDKQPALSIGAIAVAPSDSDVIWVGTGEANDRNSSDWGNGVYRSTDGGENWQNVGLKNSRAIARIVVDPKKPEVAYVAAMGHLWADGGERGLFKTTDGGKTWKLILQAPAPHNAHTGCGDVILDPANPQIVYATLYARQRTPWSFSSGPSVTGSEDAGGIFKSESGGASWKKLSGGLPGQTGRIGLAISASNPKVVMAVVQSYEGGTGQLTDLRSKSGGVFRSEDGGEKWTRMSAIDPRPFYFSQIRIDPANDQRVYLLQFALLVSDDGGKNFREDLSEKFIPIVTRSRFNRERFRRRNRQNPRTKTNRPSRRSVSVCCSEPMAAFIKVSPAAKIGTISTKFRRENFIGSRWTIRNRTSASRADFRTTRTGSGRAPCRAKKGFAIRIGPRSPAATAFTCCSIRPITTRSMPKVRAAPCTGFNLRNGELRRAAARADRRPAEISVSLELAVDHEPAQTGRDLSGRQLRLQINRPRGKIFRHQSGSHAQRSRAHQRDRKRRGKLRRGLFVSRIAEARGITLGRNRRRTPLDHRK